MTYPSHRRPLLPIDQWPGFLLAAFGMVLGAAALEFFGSRGSSAAAPHMLFSLEFGSSLVLAGLVIGCVVAGIVWVAKRRNGVPPGKETVLWYACILTTVVCGARLLT